MDFHRFVFKLTSLLTLFLFDINFINLICFCNNLNEIKSILNENEIDREKILKINNQIIIIEDELEKENPDVSIIDDVANYMKTFITQVLTGAIANLLL